MPVNIAFSNGEAETPGYGQKSKIKLVGTWPENAEWLFQFTTTEGDATIGAGNLSNALYSFLLTFGDRVYMANGSKWNHSANTFEQNGVLVAGCTKWEEQNAGAGSVPFTGNYGPADLAKAFAVIQGRLAIFGSLNIQLWVVDADPANFARQQVIPNSGLVSARSVQGIGELDVLYLDRTGVRSLRSKENTLNAYVADVGIAIDKIVLAKLAECSVNDLANVRSIAEPTSKRYWLYIKDVIYVLSYFPASKISAWSTYGPTFQVSTNEGVHNNDPVPYDIWCGDTRDLTKATNVAAIAAGEQLDGGQVFPPSNFIWIVAHGQPPVEGSEIEVPGGVAFSGLLTINGGAATFTDNQATFVPRDFTLKDGIVYCRGTYNGSDWLFAYGGVSGQVYDRCSAVVEMPWQDAKMPELSRVGQSFGTVLEGQWIVFAGLDPHTQVLERIYDQSNAASSVEAQSTPDGFIGVFGTGTHIKFRAVTSPTSANPALLGSLVLKVQKGNVI